MRLDSTLFLKPALLNDRLLTRFRIPLRAHVFIFRYKTLNLSEKPCLNFLLEFKVLPASHSSALQKFEIFDYA